MNRRADVQQRQEEVLKLRDLLRDDISSKLKYLTISFDQVQLGLSDADYADVTSNVNVILHNAWKMDFNLSLDSFEVHIRGIRSLIDWSIRSDRNPRIMFIFSVFSIANWASVHNTSLRIPELPIQDTLVASKSGYGESKCVAERLLCLASERSGVSISVLRVGQLAGSTEVDDIAWPEHEWLPSLIKTSKAIDCLSDDVGPIDWIPVNAHANAILEILHSDQQGKADSAKPQIYNVVNPRPVAWSTILPPLITYCGPHAKLVSLADWVNALRQVDSPESADVVSRPALKLLPFFDTLVATGGDTIDYETDHAFRPVGQWLI